MTEHTGDVPGRPSTDEVLRDLTEPTAQEAVRYTPFPEGEDVQDEALDIVEVVQSESGVIYIGHDQWCKRVTLSIPMELLKGLAEAWAADDPADLTGEGAEVYAAVRTLFDGQDGELQFLSMIGIKP